MVQNGAGFELMGSIDSACALVRCFALQLMFNERAPAYGRAGAYLTLFHVQRVVPWRSEKPLASMAAIASGCHVVSSNRVGSGSGGPAFGGGGYAFAPDGSLLSESNEERSIVVFDLDKVMAEEQKSRYPVYVEEKIS